MKSSADHASREKGYVGLIAILIAVAISIFVFLKYYDKNPATNKSAAEANIEAVDAAKQIQSQSQMKADEINAMMR